MKFPATAKKTPNNVNQLIATGIAFHQQGHLDQAQSFYEQILKKQPLHFDALQLTGALELQKKNYDKSLFLFNKALKINPLHQNTYCNRGAALQELHRFNEAIRDFDKAIKIKPDFALAHFNRGVSLQKTTQWEASLASYQQAIFYAPLYTEAYYNSGNVLLTLKKFKEAIDRYQQSVSIKPDYYEAYNSIGNCLWELKQYDASIEQYNKALSIQSTYPEAHCNKASALIALQQFTLAADLCKKAINLKPDYTKAYNNLGNAINHQGEHESAIQYYDHAIFLEPESADAYNNRGTALQSLKKFELSLVDFNEAIKKDPEFIDAKINKSMLLLKIGDFNEGWKLYDWRWKRKECDTEPLVTPKPEWKGEPHQRLLVWAEQGLGDQIMFCSLLNEVSAISKSLTVTVNEKLIPLMSRSFKNNIQFLPSHHKVDEQSYDQHIPMGSLGQYFRCNKESFSNTPDAFLFADPQKINQIKSANPTNGHPLVCGISWRTTNKVSGSQRNVDLTQLIQTLWQDQWQFVNLQYGDTKQEIDEVKTQLDINIVNVPEIDNFNDIDGLAALIATCDLVVSIDNTTVHLAGALGKDVCVLLPHLTDWRWMTDGTRSPWHPCATLYRQTLKGEWGPVIEQLKKDLKRKWPST